MVFSALTVIVLLVGGLVSAVPVYGQSSGQNEGKNHSGANPIKFRAVPLAEIDVAEKAPGDIARHQDGSWKLHRQQGVKLVFGAGKIGRTKGSANGIDKDVNDEPNNNVEAVQDAIEGYRQAAASIEASEGIFAPALYQQLVDLAMQLEKIGKYELALAEYQKAEHIDRINHGLYTHEQIAIADRVIRILEKLGQFDQAGQRIDSYVYMHEKLYGQDSVDIVGALDRQADWHFQAYQRSIAQYPGETTGMVSYLNGLAMDNGPHSILKQTQNIWLRAIRLLVENNAYSNPILPVLEDKLLDTYFAHASLGRQVYGTHSDESILDNSVSSGDGNAAAEIEYMNFSNGVNVFRRKLHYLKQAEELSVQDFVATLVELGDWYLLFGHRGEALDTYQEAHDLMQANAIPPGKLLSPAVPVSLSGIAAHSGRQGPGFYQHDGYIDLSFTLNKYGRASKIKLLETSENTSKEISNWLIREIHGSQFRPIAGQGKAGSRQQIALRYFYYH